MLDEIFAWVLSMGTEVEVLAPEELKTMVKESVRKQAENSDCCKGILGILSAEYYQAERGRPVDKTLFGPFLLCVKQWRRQCDF